MANIPNYDRLQIGGACTVGERDELDQHLFDVSPEEALNTLEKLQDNRVGRYEHTLAIGRLYKHLLYMQEHGFPPDCSNVFW